MRIGIFNIMNFFEMEGVAIFLRSWLAYTRFVVDEKKHHLQNVCFLFIFVGTEYVILFFYLGGIHLFFYLPTPRTSRSTEKSVSPKIFFSRASTSLSDVFVTDTFL